MSIGKHLGSEDFGEQQYCVTKRKPNADSFQSTFSFHSFLETYETSKLNYEVTFFTQQLCVMLQRIVMGKALFHRRKEPIYRFMITAVKETMLTEVQVAVWSFVIRRTEVDSRYMDFSLYIRISAFAVRKITEDDVNSENIMAYLDSKGGFRCEFNLWFDRMKDRLKISCVELNEEFQILTQPLCQTEKDPAVYTFLIDELTEDTPLNLDVPPGSLLKSVPDPSDPILPPHTPERSFSSFEKHPSDFLNLQ